MPLRPVDTILGTGKLGLRQLDLALDRRQVLLEDALHVFPHRDLGHLARQRGILEVRLGALGRDLLIRQAVVEATPSRARRRPRPS